MDKINEKLIKELNLRENQVKNTIELIDAGNTIPFIARYRKEVTGGMSDEVLRDFFDRLTYLRNLETRKEEIVRIIDEQGKLTDELKAQIENAEIMAELEDLYRPYKQKKRTRATIAKEKGLEPLANIIYLQQEKNKSREEIAQEFINEEKGVNTVEEAFSGALDIIAETISDNADYRKEIRKVTFANAILTSKAVNPEEKTVYDMYYDYKEPVNKIPGHRILAMNRGEKEGVIKTKLEIDTDNILSYLQGEVITGNSIFEEDIKLCIADAYKRLIAPSIETEIRGSITDDADESAIKVFGVNVKNLLLQAPIKNMTVMGFDPAYRTGCKIAIINDTGKVLATTTVYPTEPQNDVVGAKKELKELIKKHNVNMIAIGNGTASRESEQFVADMLKEVDEKVYYTIVSEAGASVYSASKLATQEYPDINVSLRGAISIARRLQDPLAELVKIDPKSIGVGQYQHDVNQKRLDETLTGVVEDTVNKVGVDLNTATPSLLSYVSGISKTIASNIVKYREEKGKFKNRKELLKVAKLGPATFLQCSGFLRIPGGDNLLDNTAVHPESYEVAEKLLENLGYDIKSVTPSGKSRYVEVKSLEKMGDSFVITNNEYTSAHQHGENYYICLINQKENRVEAMYIQNPIKILQFEKRIRSWEWFCDK